MAAVPVQALVEPHIKTDQGDLPRRELRHQVKGLKAGIAAVAEDARTVEKRGVSAAPNDHFLQVREHAKRRLVLRHLKAGETRDAGVKFPPLAITRIKQIGEWHEPPAIVDRDHADTAT